MGVQSLKIGLILVLEEGCFPLYLVKEPFWDSYKKFCYFISTFLFKNAKLSIKKTNKQTNKQTNKPLFSNILSWSQKGKQTSFFRPNINVCETAQVYARTTTYTEMHKELFTEFKNLNKFPSCVPTK